MGCDKCGGDEFQYCNACASAKPKSKAACFNEYPETHMTGHITVDMCDCDIPRTAKAVDFGIQIAKDGRVWVCVNGMSFIRFSPKGG